MLFTRQIGRSVIGRTILILFLLWIAQGADAGISEHSDYSIVDVLFSQYRAVFRSVLGRRCVYYPSCSHYGQESVRRNGFLFGTVMALERWMRCHPEARSSGEYVITTDGQAEDTVEQREVETCWGRSLLSF